MTQPPNGGSRDSDKDEVVSLSPSENGVETNGTSGEEANQTEPTELNIADTHFMANAHELYADLRAKGPVSRVRFAGVAQETSGDGAEGQPEFFGGSRETFFVTHYDEVIETLLDDRFAVDPRSTMSSEQVEDLVWGRIP